MCDPLTIAVASVATSTAAAVGQQQAANKAARANASAAEEAAGQVLEQGNEQEARQRLSVRQMIAESRAEAGGSGLLVDSGTGFDLNEDNLKFGNLDALTIRRNAQNQANAYRNQAKIATSSQVSPLLTGSSQLLAGISQYKQSDSLSKALKGIK